MKTLYLLPFDESKVQYSFIKKELEELLEKSIAFPCSRIIEVSINDALAEQLPLQTPELKLPHPYAIPQSYYDDELSFLSKKTDVDKQEHLRIYVIFDKHYKCFWSPSGNNLNTFYDKHPEKYLCPAIRVPLTEAAYVDLTAYFIWCCENY